MWRCGKFFEVIGVNTAILSGSGMFAGVGEMPRGLLGHR